MQANTTEYNGKCKQIQWKMQANTSKYNGKYKQIQANAMENTSKYNQIQWKLQANTMENASKCAHSASFSCSLCTRLPSVLLQSKYCNIPTAAPKYILQVKPGQIIRTSATQSTIYPYLFRKEIFKILCFTRKNKYLPLLSEHIVSIRRWSSSHQAMVFTAIVSEINPSLFR